MYLTYDTCMKYLARNITSKCPRDTRVYISIVDLNGIKMGNRLDKIHDVLRLGILHILACELYMLYIDILN